MSFKLRIQQRSSEGGTQKPDERVLSEDEVLIGRDPSCQVVLTEPAVSRHHARICRDGQLYLLEDLESSFGTQVNGRKLAPKEKKLLKTGDTIALAQYDITFEAVEEDAGQSPGTVAVARQAVKNIMRGMSGGNVDAPFFRIMNGVQEGQRIEIAEAQELVLGRDGTANVVLRDDLVSRRHAKIRRDVSGTHIEDLASRNGIKVNRKSVNGQTLKDGDEIEIGNVQLLFVDTANRRTSHAAAEADDEAESTLFEKIEPAPVANNVLDEEPDNSSEPSDSGPLDVSEGQPNASSLSEDESPSSLQNATAPLPPARGRLVALIFMGAVAVGLLVLMVAILAGA